MRKAGLQGPFVHRVESNCDSVGSGKCCLAPWYTPDVTSANPPGPESSTLPAYHKPLLWAHSPRLPTPSLLLCLGPSAEADCGGGGGGGVLCSTPMFSEQTRGLNLSASPS